MAQDADTQRVALPAIEIEATRSRTVTQQAIALSASVLARPPAARNLEPALSLEETLTRLPGLWINDRNNPAIGERISIRGMGSRSRFGVRGVQVVLDGIPLTMPDGQAFADIISPSSIQRAELIRGPASFYWGNGSGGVLYLTTLQPNTDPGLRLRAMGGSYGLQQINAEAQANIGINRFQVIVSDDQRDGYRNYSQSRFTRASFHALLPLGERSVFRLVSAFADQDAQNPGSLTAAQVGENARQANGFNVSKFAAKRSRQFQIGGSLLHESAIGEFTATLYSIIRNLDNPLSFAYIDLDRSAGGARVALENEYGSINWGIGLDAGFQEDDRFNWDNNAGQRDTLRLAQHETVQTLSAFGFLNAELTSNLSLTVGIRADQIHFEMNDWYSLNGNQSGDRSFSAVSPAFGLSYVWQQATLYANYRSAFETPTTTELVNRPNLDGGFNPDVAPQRTDGFEIGLRGSAAPWKLNYDIALYAMNVDNRLAQTGTNEAGRDFFGNVGRNLNEGFELALDITPLEGLAFSLVHTSNKFEFKSDELNGLLLPGVPNHRTQASARFMTRTAWAQLSLDHVSSYFVDDDNTEKNEAYKVADINLGIKGIAAGNTTFQPFFSINNVFDVQYNGSVLINDFRSRYYEPAPGRTFQLGLNVSI